MLITAKLTEKRYDGLIYTMTYRPAGHSDSDDELWCYANGELADLPTAGQTVKIALSEYVGPQDALHNHYASLVWDTDTSHGWAGNADSTVRRYHGWRGTTDDRALYGYGVRTVKNVTITGKHVQTIRVILGRDLAFDKD